MKDIFLQGILIGLVGGVTKDMIGAVAILTKFAQSTYWDYAGRITFGKPPETPLEIGISILVEIVFSIILGIGYAYVTPLIKSRHYILKGLIYGVSIWFMIYCLDEMFRLELPAHHALYTVVANIITAAVYGVILAKVDQWLTYRNE